MNRFVRRGPFKIALVLFALLGLVLGGVVGGMAYANHRASHVLFAGGGVVQKRVATESTAFSTSSTSWVALPGSGVTISVPSRASRLVTAEFTAESTCSGNNGSWCSARIVARRSGSSTLVELFPRVGSDFAFDTATSGQDFWESHAINRSIRLGSGTWVVFVQGNALFSGSNLRLDDWHFHVDVAT